MFKASLSSELPNVLLLAFSKLEKFIYSFRSHRGHDYIIAAYQKTSESEFSVPIQGKWIHNIDKEKAKGVILNYDQPDTFKRDHS